jgi:hypothetical protein
MRPGKQGDIRVAATGPAALVDADETVGAPQHSLQTVCQGARQERGKIARHDNSGETPCPETSRDRNCGQVPSIQQVGRAARILILDKE